MRVEEYEGRAARPELLGVDAQRPEGVGKARIERDGVVGEEGAERVAEGAEVMVVREYGADAGEALLRARALRAGRVIEVEIAEDVDAVAQRAEVHVAGAVLRDGGGRRIGDEEREGIVDCRIDR